MTMKSTIQAFELAKIIKGVLKEHGKPAAASAVIYLIAFEAGKHIEGKVPFSLVEFMAECGVLEV